MNFKQSLAYEASAGSGKTFKLVVRYLSLLFMDEDASKILALTFTNKAANEMYVRILETLQHLEKYEYQLKEIAQTLNVSKEFILDKKTEVLERFFKSSAQIMTIDKFFVSILRTFSLQLGLSDDFEVTANEDDLYLLISFLEQSQIDGQLDSIVQNSLIKKQKLDDILMQYKRLYIKSKEYPFKQKEKGDIEAIKNNIIENMEIIKKIITSCPNASKTALKSVEYDSIDDIIAKSWITRDDLNYRTFSKCFTDEMDQAFIALKEALRKQAIVIEDGYFNTLNTIINSYKTAKIKLIKNKNSVSFDDITMMVYTLLKEKKDREYLYFRLDSNIDHILLDEFQDTSIIQFNIFTPLLDEILSGINTQVFKSFFYVGDIKQSIYRFRGGNSALFHYVAKYYSVEVAILDVNYRSDANIVHFVNRVFKDRIENYKEQKPLKDDNKGFVEIKTTDNLLEDLHQSICFLQTKNIQLEKMAILCSTNADGLAIEKYLNEAKIKAYTQTTASLLKHPTISGIINALKYLYFKQKIYLEAFKTFVAKKYNYIQDFENIHINNQEVYFIVKQIVDTFELFFDDINIFNFLQSLAKYKDLEQFIYEHTRLDATIASADIKGVKILTVHKSKGLEFEYVMILDRLGKSPPNRSTFIEQYDGVKLKHIYLRMKNRQYYDEFYNRALKSEEKEQTIDSLNALYVAFTRAQKALFVLQKEKGSEFSILNISDQQIGNIKPLEQKTIIEKKHIFSYEPLSLGVQNNFIKEEESVDRNALYFGNALHFTLEMLNDYSPKGVLSAIEMMKNRFSHALNENEIDDIKNRINLFIQNDEIKLFLQGTIYKEYPFVYDGKIKYIDLAIKHKDHWVIIDYKSSTKFSHKHKEQINFYAKAVSEIEQMKVYPFVVYLLADKIEIREEAVLKI
jgi:exodeoxyribonuclease V beta subunit